MSTITIDLAEYLVLARFALVGALVETQIDNATQEDVNIILRHAEPNAHIEAERMPKQK